MKVNDGIPIGSLTWTRGQRLFCTLGRFRGKMGLDIRLFFYDWESQDWCPTQKGIWVPVQFSGNVALEPPKTFKY